MVAIDESNSNKIVSCVYVCTPNHGRWPLMSDEMANYYNSYNKVIEEGMKHEIL
jgi:hypothetical protein